MKRSLGALLALTLVGGLAPAARADEAEAKAVLDKAIKALGGEEKLGKAQAISWKSKGKITFGENENPFNSQTIIQGLDRYHGEFEGEFNGNPFKGITVLDGKKGWRKFGDNVMEMDDDAVTNERRTIYLQVIPVTLVALKGQGFKLDSAKGEDVSGKPTDAIKATGPDGKDFTIYFDKEKNLPVKLVANVVGFNGEEFTQETTFADYKDFDGIKKATKVVAKRDGQTFLDSEVTDFKAMDKADPGAFAEPN